MVTKNAVFMRSVAFRKRLYDINYREVIRNGSAIVPEMVEANQILWRCYCMLFCSRAIARYEFI